MTQDPSQKHRDDMVFSYNRVRNALGILGVAFPIILIVGGGLSSDGVQPSMSDFFHTTMRDIYVGTLCAIGVFLISYRGYQKAEGEWISDDIIATTAGISAFGVALFPNESPTQIIETVTQEAVGIGISPIYHFLSAMLFFLCLSLFCYIKFPKNAKPWRRRVYFLCGHLIWVGGISVAVASYYKKFSDGSAAQAFVLDYNVIFWAEALGIWAFAVSWLVKGKADMILAQKLRKNPAA
ncbi:MAG TPA: hypothetical protein ENK28_00005 [Aliiroseovarius sp.]|nr:hypothetical protein [Aliiroseovarius sp.]